VALLIKEIGACPVCLHTDAWELEYDYTENGDIEQTRCQNCKWPPPYPSTVEQWRRHHFISPYLTELEECVERLEGALRRIQGAAGNPDAAAGCRHIIAIADDALTPDEEGAATPKDSGSAPPPEGTTRSVVEGDAA